MPFVSGALPSPYYEKLNFEQSSYDISFSPVIAPERLTFTQSSYDISFSPVVAPERLTFVQGSYNIKSNFGYTTVKAPKTIDFRA